MGPDRTHFSRVLAPRLQAICQRLPARAERAIPTLAWRRDRCPFPESLDIRCIPVTMADGRWLGVTGPDVVCVGATVARVAQVPANFDVNRIAGMAYDPGAEVIAIWQRGWAQSPSRTFFYDPTTQGWRGHTHAYRSEDEHAGVSFLYDHKRGAFVRIGVSYNARWSSSGECRESAAGVVQLALGEDGRVAVSDRKTGQTLVVDVERDHIFRVSPAGWSLLAHLRRPADFKPHQAVWSLQAGALRYDGARKKLLCSRGYGADDDHCLDLGPAFAAAAKLDILD